MDYPRSNEAMNMSRRGKKEKRKEKGRKRRGGREREERIVGRIQIEDEAESGKK
jgi:hypothetical protein